MAGSSYGNIFKVTTWGESHGKGLGVVVDGVPAGLELCEEDIQIFLNRRTPGQSKFTTPRKEDDAVEILSGVFEGKTTGTPVSMVVWNKNQKSKDYSEIASYYRPGLQRLQRRRSFFGTRDNRPCCSRCYRCKDALEPWHKISYIHQINRSCYN